MQTNGQDQEERPGDIALGCADGCFAGCGLWLLATLGIVAIFVAIVLVGACAQAIFERV